MISKYKKQLATTLINQVIGRRVSFELKGREEHIRVRLEHQVYVYSRGITYIQVVVYNRDTDKTRRVSVPTNSNLRDCVSIICRYVKKPTLEQAIARYDGLIFNQ